jgi:7-cyano-7-deazaguanine synthase in queuosine biosynthesis
MNMNARIDIQPKPATNLWGSNVSVDLRDSTEKNTLVIDWKCIIKVLPSVKTDKLASDLIFVAAIVYALDKMVPRAKTHDRWTRHIAVKIPLRNPVPWKSVATDFSSCVSFLTGDHWKISFSKSEWNYIRPSVTRSRLAEAKRLKAKAGNAVSLLSGGLDSFIGVINWLESNKAAPLLVVGHSDGDISGPRKDQTELFEILNNSYPKRINQIQIKIGLGSPGNESTYRSRSLVFLALATAVAKLNHPGADVLIPENGVIALNYPLTASRRGSCSTRTVHPKFISKFQSILGRLGFTSSIKNPLEMSTKAEAVTSCQNQKLMIQGAPKSVSCASGLASRAHWKDKSVRSCGRCVPCIFRRASLHAVGQDNESYGFMAETFSNLDGNEPGNDMRDLAFFIRNRPNAEQIRRELVCGGVPVDEKLQNRVDLILRMQKEIIVWLKAKTTRQVQVLAGL